MTAVLIFLLGVILTGLILERWHGLRDRAVLAHVIHVNGSRGKSSVTRLIDAGLRAGGLRVFSKTTGTIPMTIGTDGVERLHRRRGQANIGEQMNILGKAAREGAQALVVECMAVDPHLQAVSQHQMLHADVGVITNVRLDHTAEMGETLEDICDSLSNTIPRGSVLFTADAAFFDRLRQNAERLNCKAELVLPDGGEPDIDFPENLALSLAVCRSLGVAKEVALKGMLDYRRDPFALSVHRLPQGGVFVNALSVNDPQSTELVYRRLSEKYGWRERQLILLVNNRPDRGYRTWHMAMVAREIKPAKVWLLGASQLAVARAIKRDLPETEIHRFSTAADLPLQEASDMTVVFAVGNVAGQGHKLMERIREEAVDVS